MNFKDFFSTWDGLVKENKFHRFVVMGLLVSNVLAALAALRTERSVVLVPPKLTAEVEVTRNRASANFKQAWGLFVAELLGNVTPESIDFVRQALAPMLDSSIYREVMDDLVRQIEDIKRDRVALSFQPQEALYEPETDKVFISGRLRAQGPGSKPVEVTRTYELVIDINDYRPLIRQIDAYSGRPRTIEVIRAEQNS